MNIPYFCCDSEMLNRAARIATGDIVGNCVSFKDGLLDKEEICVMAGLDYSTPWTRDTAINSMNSVCMMDSEVVKNTLLSVCEQIDGKNYIGGQYWDAIIWTLGAWQYYMVTSDSKFLKFAYETVKNTLHRSEDRERDPEDGIFRGAAVYGDGVAAYPDYYSKTLKDHSSAIWDWPSENPDKKVTKGYGLPIKSLSTNCVYYAAYMIEAKMAAISGQDNAEFINNAQALKTAINSNFWNENTGRYDYMFDGLEHCDASEALGLAFAILFGIADDRKCSSIIKNTPVTEQGIPCLWPSFERYRIGNHYGRHSGIVWPHAQGYWALAMLKCNNFQAFDKELYSLAYKAVRDMNFAECYHPVTGEIYGGMQELRNNGIVEWKACLKQTWSASAFWSLIYYGMFGIHFDESSITIKPYMPDTINQMTLKNLRIGKAELDITVCRDSNPEHEIKLSKDLSGKVSVKLCV